MCTVYQLCDFLGTFVNQKYLDLILKMTFIHTNNFSGANEASASSSANEASVGMDGSSRKISYGTPPLADLVCLSGRSRGGRDL